MQYKELFAGQVLLIVVSVLYEIWWIRGFRPPGGYAASTPNNVLLIITVLLGVVSIVISVMSFNGSVKGPVSGWLALLIGMLVYFILLIITRFIFSRQVTTELILITGWAVLMTMTLNELYGFGICSNFNVTIFTVALMAVVIIDLFCYLIYYDLTIEKGYYVGMIPLAVNGIYGAAIIACMFFENKT